MKKIFLLIIVCLLNTTSSWSQKRGQTIAYIDMEYILENVPEYIQAQNTLDAKVIKWKGNLDKQARYIEVLKSDLANEKAILTKDLIEEQEEEITLKEEELRRLESLYFGPNGDMFLIRKQLVKPIQDKVYNAIQSIVKRKKYDFVFDKSSELVMLFSNKKYDISELVLSTINRKKLIDEKNETKKIPKKELTSTQKENLAKREAEVATKLSNKELKKKANEEKRNAAIKKREESRKLLREKKEALKKKREQAKNKKQ